MRLNEGFPSLSMLEVRVSSLGREEALVKEMVIHSTWEIPWIEEPGGLQFMGLQRVGHDLATKQQQHHNFKEGVPW